MRTYTYSEARQKLATLLDQAKLEGCVQIRRQDGSVFVLEPVAQKRSPLDVPGFPGGFAKGELVSMLREERAASGERLLDAASRKTEHSPQARPGKAVKRARQRRRR